MALNQPRGFALLVDRFTLFVLKWPWVVVFIMALLSVFMLRAAINIPADFTVQELFAVDDPEIDYLDKVKQLYGADDDLIAIVLQADDLFSADSLKYIASLTEALKKLQAIRKVESLTTLSDLGGANSGTIDSRPLFAQIPADGAALKVLRHRALASPLLRGRLISADGKASVIAANLAKGLERAKEVRPVVEEIEKILLELPAPSGMEHALTGVPYIRTEAIRNLKRDQLTFLPATSLLTMVMLIFLYRSFYGVAIPMAAIGLSTGYTVGLMSLVGGKLDILSNILPVLVMVYGVADAVHILGRVQEELRKDQQRNIAIRFAMRHLGIACLLTSFTTAVGFGSLLTSSLAILRRFGVYAACGVIIAYLITMVLVPAGIAILRLDPKRIAERTDWKRVDSALNRISAWVIKRPKKVLGAGIVITTMSLLIGSRVPVENFLLGIFREDHPAKRVTRIAEEKLQGMVDLQVIFQGKPGNLKNPQLLRKMEAVQHWMGKRTEVTGSISAVDFIKEMHRALLGKAEIPQSKEAVAQLLLMAEGETGIERLVDYSYGRGRIHINLRDVGARKILAFCDDLAKKVTELFSGTELSGRVTGTSMVAYRGINRLVENLLVSLSLALGIIAIVLVITFRSLKVGLISLIPNAMPLSVGIGFMGATGMYLDPTTAMIFTIALGIAVDDTIHFVARYREECHKGETVENAVQNTTRTAGRAMLMTTLILVLGFVSLLVSQFPATQRFGILGCVILSTALFADLFITPSCMLFFRPWSNAGPGKTIQWNDSKSERLNV
jgi:uncharacterized protein